MNIDLLLMCYEIRQEENTNNDYYLKKNNNKSFTCYNYRRANHKSLQRKKQRHQALKSLP